VCSELRNGYLRTFEPQEVSDKIAEMLSSPEIKAEVKIIFQTVEDLHRLSQTLGIGTSPEIILPGGNRVVNRAFMNFTRAKMLEHTSKFSYLVFNRFSKLFV
jgi:hypothetical protein